MDLELPIVNIQPIHVVDRVEEKRRAVFGGPKPEIVREGRIINRTVKTQLRKSLQAITLNPSGQAGQVRVGDPANRNSDSEEEDLIVAGEKAQLKKRLDPTQPRKKDIPSPKAPVTCSILNINPEYTRVFELYKVQGVQFARYVAYLADRVDEQAENLLIPEDSQANHKAINSILEVVRESEEKRKSSMMLRLVKKVASEARPDVFLSKADRMRLVVEELKSSEMDARDLGVNGEYQQMEVLRLLFSEGLLEEVNDIMKLHLGYVLNRYEKEGAPGAQALASSAFGSRGTSQNSRKSQQGEVAMIVDAIDSYLPQEMQMTDKDGGGC